MRIVFNTGLKTAEVETSMNANCFCGANENRCHFIIELITCNEIVRHADVFVVLVYQLTDETQEVVQCLLAELKLKRYSEHFFVFACFFPLSSDSSVFGLSETGLTSRPCKSICFFNLNEGNAKRSQWF